MKGEKVSPVFGRIELFVYGSLASCGCGELVKYNLYCCAVVRWSSGSLWNAARGTLTPFDDNDSSVHLHPPAILNVMLLSQSQVIWCDIYFLVLQNCSDWLTINRVNCLDCEDDHKVKFYLMISYPWLIHSFMCDVSSLLVGTVLTVFVCMREK